MSEKLINVVILAAGRGTRMQSKLPKVLHTLAGKPIISYVIDTAKAINAHKINLVYGYNGDLLKKTVKDNIINWVLQSEQLGTGHAIQQAAAFFSDNEDILILYGDVPLISIDTLRNLKKAKPEGGISLLTAIMDQPNGYGRIIRQKGKIIGVVEDKDASLEQLKINEINSGILLANATDLKLWLNKLKTNNKQHEFYITDIINFAYQEGRCIQSINPLHLNEVKGVNNCFQLAILERAYQAEQVERLLLAGVILMDPARFDLRGVLEHGSDVIIDTNVIIDGHVILGNRVKIGSGCIIKNSIISDDSIINPYSIIENAHLQTNCTVGPFARLRPGSKLEEGAHIGNFVEMKKAVLGKGSKANHLSYLGNAEIGNNVNIGAGTITCNYNGISKSSTIIGDDVFVGSNTQFIAPVSIVSGTTIAAATTVIKDVVTAGLVYNKKKQNIKTNWQRLKKKKQ